MTCAWLHELKEMEQHRLAPQRRVRRRLRQHNRQFSGDARDVRDFIGLTVDDLDIALLRRRRHRLADGRVQHVGQCPMPYTHACQETAARQLRCLVLLHLLLHRLLYQIVLHHHRYPTPATLWRYRHHRLHILSKLL